MKGRPVSESSRGFGSVLECWNVSFSATTGLERDSRQGGWLPHRPHGFRCSTPGDPSLARRGCEAHRGAAHCFVAAHHIVKAFFDEQQDLVLGYGDDARQWLVLE